MRPESVTRQLKHVFSDDERLAIADQLASSVKELSEIEREKADVNKGFKDRLEAVHGVITMRAAEYNRGYRIEEVVCAVEYNKPELGKKMVINRATGELVSEEPMTEDERQEVMFDSLESEMKNWPKPPEDGKSAAGGEL